MNPSELFDLWAPPSAVWSRWAKPILFVEAGAGLPVSPDTELPLTLDLRAAPDLAVVLDLPSATAVKAGLALAEAGFRPVPMFNGARGPTSLNIGGTALVDNDPILTWLLLGAGTLAACQLPDEAPPAFLLDSRRQPPALIATPGRFDNRWIVFPQDFPSANFLRAQGITRVLLVQPDAQRPPQDDLAHVLRRWQEAGLQLSVATPESPSNSQPLNVGRPSRFRALWYAALALTGLRRNSAGGFGSIIPQPSSGG
jgi:hypothetical protein